MYYRSATRTCRHWVIAAACGVSFAAGVGCDKKGDAVAPPAPAGAPAAGGQARSVGILDPQKMATTLGWIAEAEKQRQAVGGEIERELKTFQNGLDGAVTELRKRINTSAKLNAEQIDKLAKGDLDKLPLTKEQREEYVAVLNRAIQANQEAVQVAQQSMAKWNEDVRAMFTESAKPAVWRASQAAGVQVVLMSGQAFYFDPSVDITNQVINELQKTPPTRNFPPTPPLKYKQVQLQDLSKPATQPIVSGPGATQPAAPR